MQNTFENNIKERLQEHEISPPTMAWENISKELQKDDRPKVIPWMRWMGIAAAILIPALLTIGFLWLDSESDVNNISTPHIVNSNNSGNTNHDFNTKRDASITESNSLNPQLNSTKSNTNNHTFVQNEEKGNRLVRFIKNVFSEDETSYQTKEYPDYAIQHNQKVSILSALVSSFDTEGKVEMPEWYAYAPMQKRELQLTSFDTLKEDEKLEEIETKDIFVPKLEVNPYAGTSVLGSFDQASLIAPEFNRLSIDNELTTAYGAKAAYRLNDRLKIRSGVGVVDVIQNTYDVPMRITESANAEGYNLRSYTNAHVDLSDLGDYISNFANTESGGASYFEQDISQEVRFVEVPVEVEYKVAGNTKLDIAATAGVSTLFLNKNNVYMEGETKALLAKPTNINDVSFSANAGVKMDYKITEKVSVNIEPQFKLMLNTITENDEAQPYLIGVNAGVSYAL